MDDVVFGVHSDRRRMVERARSAADAVWSSLLSGYGPHGGLRLLDLEGDVQLLRSAASGLNEQALDADLAPFQDVARSVRTAVGDGATTATLLAAGLVRSGLELESSGVPRPVVLEGLRMARRQVMAALHASGRRVDPDKALAHVTPLGAEAVAAVVAGVQSMAEGTRHVDLDDVDVVVEPNGTTAWAPGTLVEPQHGPDLRRATDIGVLVVEGGWSLKPRTSGLVHRVDRAETMDALRRSDSSRRRAILDRLRDLGVGLLVCGGSVDETLCLDAARHGIWVWTDAPKATRMRLATATGASVVPDLDHLEGEALGRGDVRRRRRPLEGFWVEGPAVSATLVLPGGMPHTQASVSDEGERLLRAAGAVLPDPRAVPGGGRWQRQTAAALQGASIHAGGKHALVVDMVARLFGRLADGLVQNGGHDAMDVPLLHDAEDVMDPSACVEHAVSAGFEAATTLLRIDGRHDKRASDPETLRGGTGPAGSPKGMPGDIPPLM